MRPVHGHRFERTRFCRDRAIDFLLGVYCLNAEEFDVGELTRLRRIAPSDWEFVE